jgi:Ca2+-transporting ATPase
MNTAWHTLSGEQTAARLETRLDAGLDSASAAARLAQHGPNRLVEPPPRSVARMLAGQFKDVMILVLIGAAIISGVVGEMVDTLAILVIVLLNAVTGVVQEYRAERALAALKRMAVPSVRVRRDGAVQELPAGQLVPGDLLLIEAGNLLPADVRLVQVASLELNEAALTGESATVAKQEQALTDTRLPLAERSNMAFRGTQVSYGRAEGLVVATGMHTELGRIAEMLSRGERARTPLQQRLARFGRKLAAAVLVICAIIFLTGWLRGEPLLLMFITAVSLAVAAIPEALPAVITISLALGARKLVRHRALIRQLPAVETLGSVTVICSDKTGTLTQNRMQAEAYQIGGALYRAPQAPPGPLAERLWQALALNNDAELNADGSVTGEPTEVALFEAVQQHGQDPQALRERIGRRAELPFDASRKLMTTLHDTAGGLRSYTKGAPERVLALCTRQLDADAGSQPLDATGLAAQADELAAAGYRVIAVALRDWREPPPQLDGPTLETDLTFLALVALLDPPRPEAAGAVATCRAAGITPVMITGDHPVTARAVAERLGIAEAGDQVLTGADLEQLSDDELQQRCTRVSIYARVAPEQKIRIVEALQRRGEFVAMTGDGVNDAPALRRANIGVAMGDVGTDVAREAAHMVLLDDNFATIVAAVREGRRIFDNIRKFIKDTMSSNSGEIWTLFLAPFMGLPVPLLPIHILWINLVTDGLPGLAFTAEPAEPGLMQRRPRPPGESIFAHGMWQHILWFGLFVGALSIAAQAWAYGRGESYWQTVVFTVLTISQLFHSLAVRAERASLLQIGLFSNLPMLGAVLLTVALQLMVIYVPAFNGVFQTEPLPLPELLLCFAIAALVLPAVELEKWLVRRGLLYRSSPEAKP